MKFRIQLGVLLLLASAFLSHADDRTDVRVVSDLVLLDLEKFHELSFRIYHPKRPGSFPAIIYSHERGGDQYSSEAIARAWASRGYICISPTHLDPASSSGDDPATTDPRQFLHRRVSDIRFILDSLEDIGRATLPGEVILDHRKVGLAGSDWGAQVVQVLGGASIRDPETSASLAPPDRRISAFLIMNPAEDFPEGYSPDVSWRAFSRPLMVAAQSEGRSPKYHARVRTPFQNSPGGNKSLLWIEPAAERPVAANPTPVARQAQSPVAPLGFRANPPPPPQLPDYSPFEVMAQQTLLFWDAFLRGDADQRMLLRNEVAPRSRNLEIHFHFRE